MFDDITPPRKRTVMQGVRDHVRAMSAGAIFTPAELVHEGIGTSEAVRQALTRLVRSGEIRRVQKGYYERLALRGRSCPKVSASENLTRAFARKAAARVRRVRSEAPDPATGDA